MTLLDHIKDGGFKSRKLWLTIFGVETLMVGWFAAGHWKTLAPSYPTFVGGVLGLIGLYFTGNVTTKATLAKTAAKGTATSPPAPGPEQNG
jgi:hypothetical protein